MNFFKNLFSRIFPRFTPSQSTKPNIRRQRSLYRRVGYALLLVIFTLSWYLLGLPLPGLHSEAKAFDNGDGLIIYGVGSNTTPQYRTYTNSTNSMSSANNTTAISQPSIFQMKTSRIQLEAIAGFQDTSGNLNVMCFDGTSWSTEWSVSVAGAGTPTTRRFDIAFGATSGDVTVVYSRNTSATNALAYRTKSGSTGCGSANWSSASNFPTSTSVTTGTVQWVKAARNSTAGSNLDAFIWADSNRDLGTAIWDGSTFANFITLETTLEIVSSAQDVDSFDMVYTGSSGDLMVAWGSGGSGSANGAYYNVCTGNTSSCSWNGSRTAFPTLADDATALDLSADPTSDRIAFASIGNGGSDLQAAYWDGSSWTGYANLDTSSEAPTAGTKLTSTGWLTNSGTTKWFLSYDDGSGTGVSWYLATPGSSPSKQSDISSTPGINDVRERYQIDLNPFDTSQAMTVITDSTNSIFAKQVSMDGSGNVSWADANGNAVVGTLPSVPQEGFAFAYWQYIPPPAPPTLTQRHYIFEQDDGADVNSNTTNGIADTALTSVHKGERLIARIQVDNTGTGNFDNGQFELYYDQNDNNWSRVTAKNAAAIIPGYGLSGASGDLVTTNAAGSCTGGTTYSNGVWQEGGTISVPVTLGLNKCTEVAFVIDTSQATLGTTYRLKLKNWTDGADLDTYSVYPTFTIVSSGSETIQASKDIQLSMSNCTDTTWGCATVNSGASLVLREHSMAFDANGDPWISSFDNWSSDLWYARYVGSGGSGCTSSAWTCEKLEHGGSPFGEYNFMAISPAGVPYISYYDRGAGRLKVAQYVGTGGTGCVAGVTDWTCLSVDGSGFDTGAMTSMAFDSSGKPWVAEFEGTNGFLRIAQYVGSGGTGCLSSVWTCYYLDKNASVGRFTSLNFDSSGTAYVSYTDQSAANAIKIATYVGSGGSGCGTGGSAAWTCTTIDDATNILGQDYVKMAIDSSDTPWVAYPDKTAGDLWVAKYVGTGGSGCTNSTVVGAWTCTKVEATNTVGGYLSIATGPTGSPWISYYDATSTALRVATYVGGGGGSGCGGGSTDWTCAQIDNTSTSTGGYTSIGFDGSGVPWVAESDMTAATYELHLAKLHVPYFTNQARVKLDNQGYTYVGTDDTNFDQLAATTNTPIYRYSFVESANTADVAPKWIGKSSVAASTDAITFQVYRFGSTNAWQNIATNSSCSANTDCTITPTAITTNLSEYYEPYGSKYLLHFRIYQVAGSSKTLQTDFVSDSAVVGPSQATFTNSTRNLSAKYCSGAANSFTVQLQNVSGTATNPTGSTIIRLTSTSSSMRVYSDSHCSVPLANGDIPFDTGTNTATVYLIDDMEASPTWTLTAAKQSGPDTISSSNQTYTVSAAPLIQQLKGGVQLRGGTRL